MSGIKWEEPQEVTSGPGRKSEYAAVVNELKRNPGRWAVVAEDVAPSMAGYLKRRYGVEVTTRGVKNGKAEKVFARWPEA